MQLSTLYFIISREAVNVGDKLGRSYIHVIVWYVQYNLCICLV